jgi:hypothetical protein
MGAMLCITLFRPKKMLWFPLPVRVYLKPVVSRNFYGFRCGSPTSGVDC